MARKILLLLVAMMPFNKLRIILYRSLFNYRISFDSRIGMLNYLNLSECDITGGSIGRLNMIRARSLKMELGSHIDRFSRFTDVNNIGLGVNSRIMTRNRFIGTPPGLTPFKNYENFSVGRDSNLTSGHLFDLSDSITVGDDVTFGGRGTEVWTHGFDLNHVKIQAPVVVGNNVYVGSGCIIMPGAKIADSVSIGGGTVVAKSITASGFYVSSQLIRKSDAPDYTVDNEVVVHNSARFVRKKT